MASPRGEFSSRFGFLMAAAGSAVGLGNIWGFPTNAASNGGAAFLFAYLLLAFALAYPALMAELIIGRYARANGVTALRKIATGPKSRLFGSFVGGLVIVTVSFILSFYAIVSGWMLAFLLQPVAQLIGLTALADWLIVDGVVRNSLFVVVFMLLTIFIISAGVKEGIEKWATRLMPLACSYLGITHSLCVHVARCDGGTSRLPSARFFRLRSPWTASQCYGPGLFLAFFGRRNHVGLWVLHQ